MSERQQKQARGDPFTGLGCSLSAGGHTLWRPQPQPPVPALSGCGHIPCLEILLSPCCWLVSALPTPPPGHHITSCLTAEQSLLELLPSTPPAPHTRPLELCYTSSLPKLHFAHMISLPSNHLQLFSAPREASLETSKKEGLWSEYLGSNPGSITDKASDVTKFLCRALPHFLHL